MRREVKSWIGAIDLQVEIDVRGMNIILIFNLFWVAETAVVWQLIPLTWGTKDSSMPYWGYIMRISLTRQSQYLSYTYNSKKKDKRKERGFFSKNNRIVMSSLFLTSSYRHMSRIEILYTAGKEILLEPLNLLMSRNELGESNWIDVKTWKSHSFFHIWCSFLEVKLEVMVDFWYLKFLLSKIDKCNNLDW